ncbi:MAG TPA: DUF6504 family protein [Streptosporangiaceae bacterium]|nr:DUF6504 family protein [Streptosporangiaceae bacterium]
MSRTYGEPVDVWVRDGTPARFAWRGKLYAVAVVLDHWVISREWWKQQNPDLGTPAEREFWRVDASAGAGAHTGTYELRHDLATGQWMLARSWDLTG